MKKLLFAAFFVLACQGAARGQPSFRQAPLSPEEQADLTHLYELEKLAAVVYENYYTFWPLPVFPLLNQGEARLEQQAATEMIVYGVSYPPEAEGEVTFEDPDLGLLYKGLLARGQEFVPTALWVSAMLEEKIMGEVSAMQERTSHRDLGRLYRRVLRASKTHLQLLERSLQELGVEYQEGQTLIPEEPLPPYGWVFAPEEAPLLQ